MLYAYTLIYHRVGNLHMNILDAFYHSDWLKYPCAVFAKA